MHAHLGEREAVQKKTFTNWVNVHLSCHGNGAVDPIKNLYTDFEDGRLLFKLIQNLSGDSVVCGVYCYQFSWLVTLQFVLFL